MTHTRFHLCLQREQLEIADLIEEVKGLTVADRYIICIAPARGKGLDRVTKALAECVVRQKGRLVDISEINLELLDVAPTMTKEYLEQLEVLHKSLVLYIWLGYRFNGIFTSINLAFHVKEMVEERINHVLAGAPKLRINKEPRRRRSKAPKSSDEGEVAKPAPVSA